MMRMTNDIDIVLEVDWRDAEKLSLNSSLIIMFRKIGFTMPSLAN